MYKQSKALFLLCETPLHAGSGDDLGMVDLPIQREKHTGYPKIEASSLKGALREAFELKANSQTFSDWNADDVLVHRLFGFDEGSLKDVEKLKGHFKYKKNEGDKEYTEGHIKAGCLAFTDARLLLFPVKSMKGVFCWITSKSAIERLKSDLLVAEIEHAALHALSIGDVKPGEALISSAAPQTGDSIILEEFAYTATVSKSLETWATALADIIFNKPELAYWKTLFPQYVAVLHDNDFRDFTEMSTEVITRTKIDNATGTVQDGALFTEEYLPTDSIMYSLVFASDEYGQQANRKNAKEVIQHFVAQMRDIYCFQLGGNATLGKGILKTNLI